MSKRDLATSALGMATGYFLCRKIDTKMVDNYIDRFKNMSPDEKMKYYYRKRDKYGYLDKEV